MKKLQTIILLGILLFAIDGKAQLLPQFSQYMFSDYLINPALGGTHDYWQIKTNYRYQWAGITDAPRTYMLGAYGPHKRLPMGYGGYIFNDVVGGALSNTGIYGSYAYNIKISGDIRISMGLFVGVVYEKIDLSVLDPDDPIVLNNGGSATNIYPDGSLGVHLYTSQYWFGLSASHIFFNNQSLRDDFEYETGQEAKIKQMFNIQGGYRYNINRNFDLEPTLLIKTAFNYDFMTDISIRTIYQKMVWGGLGVRYNFKEPEALMMFVGYNYSDMVNIGYSYDFTLSGLSSQSTGSHEIMIGVQFNAIKRSRSKRKIR